MQVYLDDIMALARASQAAGSAAKTIAAWNSCEDLIAGASYADLNRFLRHLPEFADLVTLDCAEAVARSLCEDAQSAIERAEVAL